MSQTETAKFVRGSTLRHVLVMTTTSALGLVAVFLVDFVDLYFISQLGEKHTAAIGFALPINFVLISVGLGLMVASIVLVSNATGSGDQERANRYVVNIFLCSVAATAVSGLIVLVMAPQILTYLGAKGETFDLAHSFLQITLWSTPFLGTSICMSGILRASGDVATPMICNLAGALLNLILDPIFIFYLDMGIEGAAYATFIARMGMFLLGVVGVFYINKLICKPDFKQLISDIPKISFIAGPAVMTSLATPVGDIVVTKSISGYGDEAVAGWAIISRIIPLAFGALFSLSGSVGPIIGQNLGARLFERVFGTIRNAIIIAVAYVMIVWVFLGLSHEMLADLFNATGQSRELVQIFCVWLSPLFLFVCIQLISNSAFNNLGKPYYSTGFNWARTTFGALPLIYLGSLWFGPAGVIGAYMLSGLIFGSLAYLLSYLLVMQTSQKAFVTGT